MSDSKLTLKTSTLGTNVIKMLNLTVFLYFKEKNNTRLVKFNLLKSPKIKKHVKRKEQIRN